MKLSHSPPFPLRAFVSSCEKIPLPLLASLLLTPFSGLHAADVQTPALNTRGIVANEPTELLSQVSALFKQRDWKQMTQFFERHSIQDWPKKEQLEAFRLKSLAFTFSKRGVEAESTIREAIQLQPEVPDWWLLLGENFKLNFTDKSADELSAYQEALRLSGKSLGWQRFSAAIAIAKLYTDDANGAEALKVLDAFVDTHGIPSNWLIKILRAQGHALASLGQDAPAAAKFREALQLEKP